jgi:hypothetical protein
MPNLFPAMATEASPVIRREGQVQFGKSWKFDFETGEFVLTPTGKVIETTDNEAWLEWCKKAIHTGRYRHLAYSRNYGQEFEDLIGKNLTREAKESEIQRMATECLMTDPRTARVDNFTFQWNQDTVVFSCEIASVRGSGGIVYGSVVNG